TFSPGTGDGSLITTSNYGVAITGLSVYTEYTLYYQADCGSGNKSTWVGPFTFTTQNIGDGTASIVGIEGFPNSSIFMMEFNDKLTFFSNSGLSEYDGTSITTVVDSNGHTHYTDGSSPVIINGSLFFTSGNGYMYDGINVSELKDINNQQISLNLPFKGSNDTVYVGGNSISKFNGSYIEHSLNIPALSFEVLGNGAIYYIDDSNQNIYKHINGTTSELTINGNSFNDYAAKLIQTNGKLIASSFTKTWVIDENNVSNIQDGAGNDIGDVTEEVLSIGNLLFFTSWNQSTYDKELWAYDGTSASAIATSFNNSLFTNIQTLREIDGVLYFIGETPLYGAEWYKYENGVVTMLVDADSGTGSGASTNYFDGNPICSYNGSIFFQASNGTDGYELWKYNGTTAYMVKDINLGNGHSQPSDMIVHHDTLFFIAEATNTPQRRLFAYVEVPSSASITFSEPVACKNDNELLIPITIDDITSDVGAISLVFDYDISYMTYDAVSSSHNELNAAVGGNFYINDVNGSIFISWADNNAATFENGDTLFTLKFVPNTGNTFATPDSNALTWNQTIIGNCEIADESQIVLDAVFIDSSAMVRDLPTGMLNNDLTINNTLCNGETALFTATGGSTYEYFVEGTSQGAADVTATYSSTTLLDNEVVTVNIVDDYGCITTLTDTIIVRDLPTVSFVHDKLTTRICSSDTVNFVATGADEYIFKVNSIEVQGQSIDSTYDFLTPATNDLIEVIGINSTTGCQNDGDVDYTLTLDGCFGLNGSIVYKNTEETAMGNVDIRFMAVSVDTLISVTESTDGTFGFLNLYDDENYVFSATTAKTHGGINSTDALGIMMHAIGLQTYTGIELKASDVDGINSVNATDALLVMQRFVRSINSFNAGDWVFEDKTYNITTNFADEMIYSLAMGDVNGSYTPNTSENASIFLANNGIIDANTGDVLQIPVSVANAATMGAMSLSFYYPSHLMTINQVTLANGNSVLFNIEGDELRIAWADLTAMNLQANDVVLNINATINNASDLTLFPITINNVSEIADGQAIPFTNITLEMPTFQSISTGTNGVSTAAIPIRNFPNPFSDKTTIEYTLPTSGEVTLMIRNATGSEVRTIVSETQSAGKQQVLINGQDLSAGTYFYTITVQEANRSYTVTKRMMVLK
ncbi:MAG: T9SS type A sorting domain-containing protein, partial [Saprospiraceae bacterium]